ncbi:MAG: hypothetical protein WA231_13275, partial [Methylocella sp.]
METGRVVYAPFIPSFEMELEFLKNEINLPDYFNAEPCFHQKYDWLVEDRLKALLSLQIPFLDGLDIETISKVKEDYHDEFSAFSRVLLESIKGIKASFGTQEFTRELRYIQKNQIEAGVCDVEKTVRRIASIRTFRKCGDLFG